MTVSNELVSVQVAGNGVQTTFTYPFMIPAQSYARLVLTDEDGNETDLALTSWTLTGVNNPAGGTFTYPRPGAGGDPAPSGSTLTLIRDVPFAQLTNLRNQGAYYPQTVEGALDFIVMQVQQLAAILTRAVRVPPNEPVLPPLLNYILRANKILGFGSAGELTYYDALNVSDSLVTTTGGNTARSLAARFDDPVDVRDFGAVGDWDGAAGTDNTDAINAAFAYAVATQRVALVPAPLDGKLGFYCADTVSLLGGAAGLHMVGTIYSPGSRIALLLGDGGTNKNQYKVYSNLSVRRTTQSDWLSEADIGIRIRNADGCVISTSIVAGFTIGVQTYGDGTGFEDSTLILGTHLDNKIALDVRTNASGAWNNSVRYIGGHIANQSATNTAEDRYGVRFSNAPGGYELHNMHAFFGTAFELQDHTGTGGGAARCFYFQSDDGRGVTGYGLRAEASSQYLALVDGAWNDTVLEFAYVGTYGFNATVEYASTATRSGVSLRVLHQAAAAHETQRVILDVPHLRSVAYMDETISTGGIGFEKLAVLSGAPSGPPTTLNGFCFPGLASIGLLDDYVQLPTSRAIAAVLPCDTTKEFFVGFDGDNLRLVVLQFDASENLLGEPYPPTLSNANVTWNPSGTSYWWEMSTNFDQLSGGWPLSKLQRVRAHEDAAFIVIGARGGDSGTPANNHFRAFRIYTSALDFPSVLFGNGRSLSGTLQGRRWGSREWSDQATYDFPSVAAGGTGSQEFVANGCRQGDDVSISYKPDSGFQSGLLRYDVVIGGSQATDRVVMWYENVSGGTINPAAGTMQIYGRRRRALNV